MKDKVEVKTSKTQGKGVFALQDFNKGYLILIIDDSHVVNDESKLTDEQHAYDLDYLDDKIVLMQSPEKFINHSCDPNSFVKTIEGIRKVFAMKDIKRGKEITYDYAVNGDNDGTFVCRCGSKKCRKIYQGNFFKLPIEIQKYYLPYLDRWFATKYRDEIAKLREIN